MDEIPQHIIQDTADDLGDDEREDFLWLYKLTDQLRHEAWNCMNDALAQKMDELLQNLFRAARLRCILKKQGTMGNPLFTTQYLHCKQKVNGDEIQVVSDIMRQLEVNPDIPNPSDADFSELVNGWEETQYLVYRVRMSGDCYQHFNEIN